MTQESISNLSLFDLRTKLGTAKLHFWAGHFFLCKINWISYFGRFYSCFRSLTFYIREKYTSFCRKFVVEESKDYFVVLVQNWFEIRIDIIFCTVPNSFWLLTFFTSDFKSDFKFVLICSFSSVLNYFFRHVCKYVNYLNFYER